MIRKIALFLLALILVAAAWEGYKLVGPDGGGVVLGMRILPRANDVGMPHVWTMGQRLVDTESRTSSRRVWQVVLEAAWYSFRLAFAGFVLGSVVGIALATVMARFGVVRRGLLPYLVVSQTVPLIALAPLVVSWGGKLELFGWEWPRWMSVTVLGAFLAFFPVAVGTLRGLESASTTALELMRSFAASSGQTMRTLRFPSAVPHLVPALKLAGAGAVIGVVVAEISTASRGGVGRLILEYSRQATGDPAKVYSALFGAAVLGLAMAGVVTIVELVLTRNLPPAQDVS
jgi:NitT/TauT family transport system permease protein